MGTYDGHTLVLFAVFKQGFTALQLVSDLGHLGGKRHLLFTIIRAFAQHKVFDQIIKRVRSQGLPWNQAAGSRWTAWNRDNRCGDLRPITAPVGPDAML